eukprot:Awhi_evm2s8201
MKFPNLFLFAVLSLSHANAKRQTQDSRGSHKKGMAEVEKTIRNLNSTNGDYEFQRYRWSIKNKVTHAETKRSAYRRTQDLDNLAPEINANNSQLFKRSLDNLAPEMNANHPQLFKRSSDTTRYTIKFYNGHHESHFQEFQGEHSEFIIKELPLIDAVHIEIPDAIKEEVIFNIRQKQYVEAVENELTIREHNMYWNKDMVNQRTETPLGPNYRNGELDGKGRRTKIIIIDSGIDDHVEFGMQIDRTKSLGFGTRSDSYDCRGHGTQVAGVAAGNLSKC